MTEKQLVTQIKDFLDSVPDLFYWKEHGGMYGTGGIPDIIICYKGKFIGLECKVKNRKPTALQEITIRKINQAGGVAVVVYSLAEVKKLIKQHS